MRGRLVYAVCVALGAVAGYFAAAAADLRRSERRTLTEADQRWMAATRDEASGA